MGLGWDANCDVDASAALFDRDVKIVDQVLIQGSHWVRSLVVNLDLYSSQCHREEHIARSFTFVVSWKSTIFIAQRPQQGLFIILGRNHSRLHEMLGLVEEACK